jgi:iron complex transport system ATP-binding protein
MYVDKGYRSDEPERDLAALVARLGIGPAEPYVGLMTGVSLEDAAVVAEVTAGPRVVAIVTVGLGNASAAGRNPWTVSNVPSPGTINTIVIVDAELTAAAMVNAVIVATEAKTLALLEARVRTRAGELASGTSSDAVVIGATKFRATGGGGQPAAPLRYAGPATPVGLQIGRAVREAIARRLPRP